MPTSIYRKDGWYKCEKFDQLIFVRGKPINLLTRPGHYHQDFGHFVLFRSGIPVLVDGGRKHYLDDSWGNFGLHPEAHNTITIDDYGLSPRRPTNFPGDYSQAPYTVSITEDDEALQIDIDASGFKRLHRLLNWQRKKF